VKVLVAAPSRAVRNVLTGVLRHHCGLQDVDEARDGFAAANLAAEGGYGMFFLDRDLPGRDFRDVLREIRAAGFEGPVFLILPEGGHGDFADAVSDGASYYVIRPFSLRKTAGEIRKCIMPEEDGSAESAQ
jgi:two-component system, chemotaxis family, chemotaxis protein CheY